MSQTKPPLPTPTDRPEADIVLYDGECNFCRMSVRKLAWWDCQGRLAYLSLHEPAVAERWPDISLERLHEEMCVVDQAGRRHWGPYALRRLTLRLRRLWWLAPVLWLPGVMLLARPAYRLIAKNRYRLMGRTEECESGACSIHR